LAVKLNLWPVAIAAIASLLIGFAASTLAYRYRILRLPGQPVLERMNRELGLTLAQREQIQEIMRETRFKVRSQQHEFQNQRRELFAQALVQIRSILTPEQQRTFDREFTPPLFAGAERERRGGGRIAGPPPASPQSGP